MCFWPDILPRDGQALTPTSQIEPQLKIHHQLQPQSSPYRHSLRLSDIDKRRSVIDADVEQHERHRLPRHELHTERHFWLGGSHAAGHDDLFDYLCRCGRLSRAASVTVRVTAPPNPVPDKGETESLWRQNDSIMLLLQGENVEICYVDPTDFIKRTGVVSGDLEI